MKKINNFFFNKNIVILVVVIFQWILLFNNITNNFKNFSIFKKTKNYEKKFKKLSNINLIKLKKNKKKNIKINKILEKKKLNLVIFIYLKCKKICPSTIGKIIKINKKIDKNCEKYKFIIISFDFKEKKRKIKEIKKKLLEEKKNYYFYKISKKENYKINKKLKKTGLWIKNNRKNELIHNSSIYLINKNREIIKIFDTSENIKEICYKLKKIEKFQIK